MDLNILSQPQELVLRQPRLSERLEQIFERLSASAEARETFFQSPSAVLQEQLGMEVSPSSKISTANRALYRLLNCDPELPAGSEESETAPYMALLRKALAGHPSKALAEMFARGFNAEASAKPPVKDLPEDSAAELDVDSDADIDLDTDSDLEIEIDVASDIEAELEAEVEAELEIQLASRLELKAIAETKTSTTTTTTTETKASTAIEVKAATVIAAKTITAVETKVEAQTLTRVEVTVEEELRAELEVVTEAELTTESRQPQKSRRAMARGRLSRLDIQRLAGFVAARPALAKLVLSSPAARARGSR